MTVLDYGLQFRRDGDKLRGRQGRLPACRVEEAGAAAGTWRGLIGEYGWDHNTLYILEKDGKLHALIEWFFLYPLEEVARTSSSSPTAACTTARS